MNKHVATAGPSLLSGIRSLLAFRHQHPLARAVSTIAAFASAMVLALVFVPTPAANATMVCPAPGDFEIDGDMTLHTCSTPADDWNTPGLGVATTTQGGTYSTAGKDGDVTSTWVSSGSTPDKTNFERAYAASRTVDVGGDPHFFVYVGWDRTDTAGTQGYAIEINNTAPHVAADLTPQPDRSDGTAVVYVSSQGSDAPTFDSACTFTSQSDYGDTCVTDTNPYVTIAVNSTSINDPLNNPPTGTTQVAGSFFEVAIDVTGLTGITPSCPGAAANSVYLRSVTGQTKNGNLKGYMAPLRVAPDSTCVAPEIDTTATPGNSTIDGLHVTTQGSSQADVATVDGTGGAGTGTVDFFLCQPSEVTAGGCVGTAGTQVGGSVTLDNGTATSASTTNTTTLGTYCWRAEYTPATDPPDGHYLPGTHTNADSECFTVAHANPTISTQSSFLTAPGAAPHSLGFTALGDTATLSDVYPGASLTGQHVSFSLYGPLDGTPGEGDCTTGATGTRIFGPTTGDLTKVDATTWQAVAPTYTPTAADGPGSYTWIASYNGDDINARADGVCGAANETQHLGAPGLTIDKRADAPSVNAGSPIGFWVTASNNGGGTATGVLVDDPLPTGPGIAWTIPEGGSEGPLSCAISAGTLTCSGSLDPDETETVHVTSPTQWTGSGETEVNSCLGGENEDGVYDNTAQVSATNVAASPTADAQTQVLCPDLHVTKAAGATAVAAGAPIGFTVTASNTGAGDATGALVNDPLPGGVAWSIDAAGTSGPLACGISGGTLTCTGTLGADETQTVHVTAATGVANCATYDNTASLTATNTPQSPRASASTTVVCPEVIVSPPKSRPPAVLPNTGGPDAWLLAAGLALMLGGGSMALSGGRRRRRS